MHAAERYARAVCRKRRPLPAGKYHRLACARHLADLQRAKDDTAWPYIFSEARADRALRFFGKLRHYKGRQFAGQYLNPEPWQRFVLGAIFGWVRREDDTRRRFHTAYVEIPRKNGKSFLAAGVALYVTFFDGEAGGEGYCAAMKRDQAAIVFGDASKMVTLSPELSSRLAVQLRAIHWAGTHSKLSPLGKDTDGTDGLNWNLCVLDEFHAQKTRALVDVLESATGARENQLMLQITTAGKDPLSPCGEQHDYIEKILDGVLDDDGMFGFIAHADKDDDPADPRTWAKANPNLGVSVAPSALEALVGKATHIPSAMAEYKQKRLNIWQSSAESWLDVDQWKKAQALEPVEVERRRRCYVGVDLASKMDMCAVVALFPPEEDGEQWQARAWFYLPEADLEDKGRRARAPYRVWADAGWLTLAGQALTDQDVIKADVLELSERYQVARIAFDPWNATKVIGELQDELGEDVVAEIGWRRQYISPAARRLEELVAVQGINANGHPILTWNVSNAQTATTPDGAILPIKDPRRLSGRVDGLAAACEAMAAYIADELDDDDAGSVYDERGAMVL